MLRRQFNWMLAGIPIIGTNTLFKDGNNKIFWATKGIEPEPILPLHDNLGKFISIDITGEPDYEDVFKLGELKPYCRYISFPIENVVTMTFEYGCQTFTCFNGKYGKKFVHELQKWEKDTLLQYFLIDYRRKRENLIEYLEWCLSKSSYNCITLLPKTLLTPCGNKFCIVSVEYYNKEEEDG